MQKREKIIQSECSNSSKIQTTSIDPFDLISDKMKQYLCLVKDDSKYKDGKCFEIDISKIPAIPNFALLSTAAFKDVTFEVEHVSGNINSEYKLREILNLVRKSSWIYAEGAEWRLEDSLEDSDNDGILPTHDNRVKNWLIIYDFDCKWKEIGEFVIHDLNVYLDDICLSRNGIRWYPYRYKRKDVDIEDWKREA